MLMRDNKFPQTLQETVYPEAPSMSPILPLPAESATELIVQDHDAIDRANAACSVIPGVIYFTLSRTDINQAHSYTGIGIMRVLAGSAT